MLFKQNIDSQMLMREDQAEKTQVVRHYLNINRKERMYIVRWTIT